MNYRVALLNCSEQQKPCIQVHIVGTARKGADILNLQVTVAHIK